MALFWNLLLLDAWQIGGSTSTKIEHGNNLLRERLFAWYNSELRQGRPHARVNQWLPTTLGKPSERAFRVHAAATNGLLYFARSLLSDVGTVLGDRLANYRQGLECLITMDQCIKTNPMKFPLADQQRFVDAVCIHIHCLRRLSLEYKPKHHWMIELAGRFSKNDNAALVSITCPAVEK